MISFDEYEEFIGFLSREADDASNELDPFEVIAAIEDEFGCSIIHLKLY